MISYSWDFSKEEFNLDLDFFNEKEQEDRLWQARTGLNPETLCGAIESVIFMSDRPVTLQKIKNFIDPDLPLRVIHESISKLQEEYEAKHHGIRLMEVAEGYQFRTKATFSRIIQNMFKVSSMQLSPTALEVMAIIAYKQPISKTGIEKIRGVDSSHIVRALMDKRLVKTAGRSEEVGKPSLYATTQEFLEIFNLNTINDLPSEMELEELIEANAVGEISEIKSIVHSEKITKFNLDELQELDELSSAIKGIASETLFTESLKCLEKNRKTEEGVEKKSAFDILEEHVNKAQVIEQNKQSFESETVTTMMEPKPVSIESLAELLNAPEVEGIEDEMQVDELDALEEKLEAVLETSENIIHDEIETAPAEELSLADEAELLADELDKAFDNLMGDMPVEESSQEAVTEADIELEIPEIPQVDALIEEETTENL